MFRLALILFISISCRPAINDLPKDSIQHFEAYDLKNPSQSFVLTSKLKEISGLGYDNQRNRIVSINDEKGIVYFIDPITGVSAEQLDFHKSGDFEGICTVDSLIYTVKSNGNISRIKPNGKEKTFKTELSQLNDVEGLCYSEKDQKLLLACKAQSTHSNNVENGNFRAVYSFDLKEKKLDAVPFIKVNVEALQDWYKQRNLKTAEQRTILSITRKSRVLSFAPSGIAIHPITNDYYLLSARGKILLILDQAFGIRHIELLDARQHNQAEGICFDTKGNLFISNEGTHITSKLYRYNYLNGTEKETLK